MLDSSKPATLSAGMGAFVAIASVSVLIVIGTVICVTRYRRRARLRGSDMLEVNENYLLTCQSFKIRILLKICFI